MPDEVRERLRRQLAPYRHAYDHVRWTSPDSWHLTLLFLGAVAPGRVPELERLVDEVAARSDPYRVRVDVGGGRARRQDGVAWLALSDGAGALIRTADLSARACPSDITEGSPPRRTPSAHLTVARKTDEAVVQALRVQAHGTLGVEWQVDRIQLVRSFLEPSGARYAMLHESPL